MPLSDAPQQIADAVAQPFEGHADQHRPFGGYAALVGAFNLSMVAFLVAAERRGRLPERYPLGDLALLSAGTFKLSRLIAKDRVTSVLRAPFTTFQDDVGHGEVDEAARGRGLRRAIGELLVCDYCVGQWAAGAYLAGYALAPRPTRAIAALFTIYGASDVLQLAYSRLEESSS
jgi:hypothetical protein